MLHYEKIPAALRELPQWVLWKTVQRDRPTKVPYQPNGELAKANDPATWCTFDEAVAAYEAGGYDGIGFEFSADDEFCGIDLDGCRNPGTGEVAPWAKEIILQLDTYAEVSPSQTGVKLFAIGKLEGGGRKKELLTAKTSDKNPAIEVYDRGRYFAVTGLRLNGPSEPQNRQQQITRLVVRHWPGPPPAANFRGTGAVLERARAYLSKIPPAISGSGGHNATFYAACVLVCGFTLDREQAMGLLQEWNQSCQPPWSERELQHKVDDAFKQPGERGYLRDASPDRWWQIQVPSYTSPPPPKPIESMTMVDAMQKCITSIREGSNSLLTLGLDELDDAIGGGVERGEMVIIAGRPSHGKSLIALQIIHHWTSRGIPCLVISEEMSALAIGKRALQFASEVPSEHWKARLDDIAADLKEYAEYHEKCFIVESARTVDNVARIVEHHVAEHGVQAVAIDYAQLLSAPGKSRYEQITNTSVTLRALANQHKIALLTLCQLSRSIESRQRFIPQASDLKDSGQLEQDADVVICCVWPHRIDIRADPKLYEFYPLKNRNRAINSPKVECHMIPHRQTVEQPTYGQEWQPNPDRYVEFE